MSEDAQSDLFQSPSDVHFVQLLLEDLHSELPEKIGRFKQLGDLCRALGSAGTMIPGGQPAFAAWVEARSSFVHGNYVATIFLCQSLAEQMLAAELTLGLFYDRSIPKKISFNETLKRSLERGVLSECDAVDLRKLMGLRNPLAHYRHIDDPENLDRRDINDRVPFGHHLRSDASFAISMAVRLMALPSFRVES